MRTIIIIIGGLISGYIVSNLEDKQLTEIIEELLSKSEYWVDEIEKFIGETIDGIEGADSETLKLNVDAFVAGLGESVEEFLAIDDLDDRVRYVEDKIAKITEELLERVKKIEAQKEEIIK